jgi:CheY-like chemotaxis protein
MKLNYKILWVDDNIEEFIDLGIKDELTSFVELKQFISIVDCFEETRAAITKLKAEKYDLILSDYNIDEKEQKEENQGDYLINHIRKNNIYTEVLFYSAQPNFKEIAMNLYQDRVSFYSLIEDEAYKGFKNKTFNLIDLTVAKLEELNNIRGLVMSETSELDNTIEEIIYSFLSKGNENSLKLKDYIIKSIISSTKSNFTNANKFLELDNTAIVKSRLFDADKKSRTIDKILHLLEVEDERFIDFYKNYKVDVLDTRNDLAHAKSDIIDGIEYLIISRKDGDHPIKYNQERCIQIRKNLRNHSELLRSIREITIK